MSRRVVGKVVSGGETGADRAALDAAIALGLAYGGWCPAGGWAEDLPDPPGLAARYPYLRTTEQEGPAARTELNVRDSDVTLVLRGRGAESPGTDLTVQVAARLDRPLLVVDPFADPDPAPVRAWLEGVAAELGREVTLNVAGPRESEQPGAYAAADALLRAVLQ